MITLRITNETTYFNIAYLVCLSLIRCSVLYLHTSTTTGMLEVALPCLASLRLTYLARQTFISGYDLRAFIRLDIDMLKLIIYLFRYVEGSLQMFLLFKELTFDDRALQNNPNATLVFLKKFGITSFVELFSIKNIT